MLKMHNKHDVRIDRTKLHPNLDHKLGKLLDLCEKQGIYLIITEGFRTKEYQDKLYAQGRTAPGKIVTSARGSSYSSQHQWGIAFDIAINDKKLLYSESVIAKVAHIAKTKCNLGWGGDWKSFKDTPHFHLKNWGTTTIDLKVQYGTFEKFKATWTKEVFGTKKGLTVWKTRAKVGKHAVLKNGTFVKVLYTKSWYCCVKYDGKIGYMKKKYLR